MHVELSVNKLENTDIRFAVVVIVRGKVVCMFNKELYSLKTVINMHDCVSCHVYDQEL